MFQLKWVWKNLEGCRKRYVFALCSTAVLSMMALVNSVLTAQIMDHRIYAGKRGAGHYAGALASARCARLHSDRFHDVQNVL